MAKIDPFTLTRPKRVASEISAPLSDGRLLSIRLRPTDILDEHRIEEAVAEMVQTYIVGEPEEGPAPFPAVGGEAVAVSERIFRVCCRLAVMQCGDPGENYTAEELVAIAAAEPGAFDSVLAQAFAIERERPDPKDTAATTEAQ